ncbi:MAG TPA: MTH1187 family thiamine-binding protein [Candidatus Limnocylindrales bacterium]|nr:MTH1187 family thiamine-binding protein [Candidatus Limnocylindrales bacterium]
MAIVDVTIIPLGTGSTSLSDFVTACQLELQKHGESEGLICELTAMGTIIEGDLDKILAAVRQMHEVPFRHGAMRVSTTVRIDDRRDKPGSIKQKVTVVQEKLAGKPETCCCS